MLKVANSLISKPVNDWRSHLQWGDIVLFCFPATDKGSKHTTKYRSCAVLEVSDVAGKRFVTLVSGDAIETKAQCAYETHVTRPEAMKVTGLEYPTRFLGRRRITVSINHKGFDLGFSGTPVIGLLTGPERDRFNDVRARVQADLDMAAFERAEHRRNRVDRKSESKWLKPRDVIIAHRPLRGRIHPIELV